jgi:hypothetical protein
MGTHSAPTNVNLRRGDAPSWQDKCFTFDMDTAFVVDQCESESDIRSDVTSNDVSVKSMTR